MMLFYKKNFIFNKSLNYLAILSTNKEIIKCLTNVFIGYKFILLRFLVVVLREVIESI